MRIKTFKPRWFDYLVVTIGAIVLGVTHKVGAAVGMAMAIFVYCHSRRDMAIRAELAEQEAKTRYPHGSYGWHLANILDEQGVEFPNAEAANAGQAMGVSGVLWDPMPADEVATVLPHWRASLN